jgi:hypothetical protein
MSPAKIALLLLTLLLASCIASPGTPTTPAGGALPADIDFGTTRLSDNGIFRATYSSDVTPTPLNELHTWTLHVETADGAPVEHAVIKVSGDMPEHGHGMPTQPQVTQELGGGDYRVEGMRFQMGGWWMVVFDITASGATDRVTFNLQLK